MYEPPTKYKLVVLIVILLSGIYIVSGLLDAILLSVVLAYMIRPLAKRVERYTPHYIATFIAIFMVITPILAGLVLSGYQIGQDILELSHQIPDLEERFNKQNIVLYMSQYIDMSVAIFIFDQLEEILKDIGQELIKSGIIVSIPLYLLIQLIFIPFITFYLISDRRKIQDRLVSMYDGPLWGQLLEQGDQILSGIFVGQFLTAIITGIIAAAGFWMLGVPYASVLGFLVGVSELLPIIGSKVVGGFLVIVYFLIGDFTKAISLALFSLVFLWILTDIIIRPKIVSAGSKVHPLLVILGFIGGSMVMGTTGFIIGPAVLGIGKVVVDLMWPISRNDSDKGFQGN